MNASYSAWPRFDLRHTSAASVVTARILSNFGFPSLSFAKSAGSVSVAGPLKLRWFSHPIQFYLHVPNVSILIPLEFEFCEPLFVLDRKGSNLK